MQYKNFGKFVRQKREALSPKVSLNKFALENDIDPAILCRIETLKQDVKLNIIAKIAKGFNLEGSELLAEFEHSPFKEK